jgi:hypothetical protein
MYSVFLNVPPSAGATAERIETPRVAPEVAGSEQFCGESESRKIGCGTGRIDKREPGAGDTPRRPRSFHARRKCAANPYCRICRSARTPRIRPAPPRRRNAIRRPGIARGATSPVPPRNPSHFVFGNGGDYHNGKWDKANCPPPGERQKLKKEYAKPSHSASSNCACFAPHVQ